ncbi:hypothetical protein WJX84_006565 [Apatococcus fuscideae]|uniref:aldehyde dehydrogenase (NAD(+)) n=1 Tax=Apatococcus fuscideae TaxID=2026836 RepID=A0AAW1SR91_9CHLO
MRYEPLGVVAMITPWNYPIVQAVEVGLPPGVLNIVTGLGHDAGAALSSSPRVAKVSFTGSVATGRRVGQSAAANIKPSTLELGGKSALIIFEDADVNDAVEWAMFGVFWTTGQICSATSRVLVHSSRLPAFKARLKERSESICIADPHTPDSRMGPIVNKAQYHKVMASIKQAKTEGVPLLTGGGRPSHLQKGYFVQPTVFTEVEAKHTLWTEEVFGPVMGVSAFETEEQAVAMANDTNFGLAAAVISKDEERCRRVAAAMEAGIVWMNCSQPVFFQAPWGGIKESGYGRELGEAGLTSFLNIKQVTSYKAAKRWDWYPGANS